MKKSKDLHAELAKRKYKIPNSFLYGFYYVVGRTHLLGAKYHPHFEIVDKLPKKGPAFVIWNHQSRRDHTFLVTACYPRKLNIVCEYNEFFRKHLAWPFSTISILPKKVFSNDMNGIRAMRSIINQGGVVAFSPEGTSSIFGNQQPIVPGTGRFLQAFRVPVYFMKEEGGFLTNSKISQNDHFGKVNCKLYCLFTPEDLAKLSSDEIDEKINAALRQDDYAWNKEQHIKYKNKGNLCDHMHDTCYRCPRCGEEFHMTGENNYIKCESCGNGAYMDDYFSFKPFDENCVIPDSPAQWANQERIHIINEIRKNPNYKFEVHVSLGYLPKDHLIDKTITAEICGDGIFTIDHKGVHFKGTKLGQEFNFDINYQNIFSYPMVTDVSIFSLYINEEYYEFKPDIPCVGKVIILTEEMHRYHINKWKNFPWNDYMYEGLELGIDNKNK